MFTRARKSFVICLSVNMFWNSFDKSHFRSIKNCACAFVRSWLYLECNLFFEKRKYTGTTTSSKYVRMCRDMKCTFECTVPTTKYLGAGDANCEWFLDHAYTSQHRHAHKAHTHEFSHARTSVTHCSMLS